MQKKVTHKRGLLHTPFASNKQPPHGKKNGTQVCAALSTALWKSLLQLTVYEAHTKHLFWKNHRAGLQKRQAKKKTQLFLDIKLCS